MIATPPTSLAEPLLQLLAVVLGRRVLDLRSQLLDAAVGQNAVSSSPESSSGLGYVYASNPVPPFSRRRECLGVAHKQVRLDRSVIPHQTKLVARLVVRREDTPHAIGRRPENGELRETCQCQSSDPSAPSYERRTPSHRFEATSISQSARAALGLIRFRGHFPKGGYDVHNGRQTAQAYASEFQ
jgi:hypothetical protein